MILLGSAARQTWCAPASDCDLLCTNTHTHMCTTGSTTHILDLESGKVVKHVEAWDVEPAKVVAQVRVN